ncbi:MAG: helix-turn-helix domain-containing protein [Acidobacteriota bacterium]|nr:helix-turn-helix domain-containing protein [Acidobacteriota bacterium]
MEAADLLRQARRRAALTQLELGKRAGVTQASISRIEDSRTRPRFDTLDRLLEACGFSLELSPRLGEGVDRTAIRALLGLTPAERARLAVEEARNLERIGR